MKKNPKETFPMRTHFFSRRNDTNTPFIKGYTPLIKGYSKCSKISNTFLCLFSTMMLLIRAGILKLLVRIANRSPDQTASSEAV